MVINTNIFHQRSLILLLLSLYKIRTTGDRTLLKIIEGVGEKQKLFTFILDIHLLSIPLNSFKTEYRVIAFEE